MKSCRRHPKEPLRAVTRTSTRTQKDLYARLQAVEVLLGAVEVIFRACRYHRGNLEVSFMVHLECDGNLGYCRLFFKASMSREKVCDPG